MSALLPGEIELENRPSIDAKALRINLNSYIYGTFAEIGAGQEVARHFFVQEEPQERLPKPLALTIKTLAIISMERRTTNAM